MRLIFIEGVSGTGKTTLAQKLCVKLREIGLATGCYLEGDSSNPIDFYCAAYFKKNEYEAVLAEYSGFAEDIERNTIIADKIRLARYFNGQTPLFSEPLLSIFRNHEFCWNPVNLIPLSEYTRVYKSVWEQFVQNTSNQLDYLIFDGSLIHHPINDMTRNYNATREQITCHLNTLIETVSSFHPQIIYMSSDSVAERLKKARISRKETPPSAEQIQFWENRKAMDLSVMQQLSIPCDIHNVTQENWDSMIDIMVNGVCSVPCGKRLVLFWRLCRNRMT